MGGPENFATHFRINPAELYELYPEFANKRASVPQANQGMLSPRTQV